MDIEHTRFPYKVHLREITQKASKGEQPFLYATHRLDYICLPNIIKISQMVLKLFCAQYFVHGRTDRLQTIRYIPQTLSVGDRKSAGTKSLFCQIMIVNKVPNFTSIFPNIFLKLSASVYTCKTILISSIRCTCTPSPFSTKSYYQISVEFQLPKMYYLIAFYLGVVNFPNATRIPLQKTTCKIAIF